MPKVTFIPISATVDAVSVIWAHDEQQGLIIEHAFQVLDRALGRRRADMDTVAHCRFVAPPKWRLNALADSNGRSQVFRNGIGVGVVKRAIKYHLGEQARLQNRR